MIRLVSMSIQDLLNRKYFEWQSREGRKTIEEFSALFGASPSLVSMWMNGHRKPTQKYVDRIIELYGDEAVIAFGFDLEKYTLEQIWDSLSPETRRRIVDLATKKSLKNDTKRTSQKRTTRESD
jgi:transcriptional regulator with XRE-family HTH domain